MKTPLHLKVLLTTLFVLLPWLHVRAQDADYALWTSIDVKKKFKHGLALSLEQEYKMRDNFSSTDKFETTIDLSWKPFSFLRAGAAYCRIDYNHPSNNNNATEYWELRHRYVAYLLGSYQLGRFNLSWREKYQQTNRVGVVADVDKANPTKVLRSKLEVDYNIRKSPITPYASMEFYYAFNEPDGVQFPPSTGMVSEIRNAIGVEYALNKRLAFNAGYLFCSEKGWDDDVLDALGNKVGGYVTESTNVLTMGLSYTF